ncbi:MAG: hypothetical protein LIO85_03520 [Rikenellaceae bacterium]|nr:hypothetical protein [Rikenellaceae bacterium]
MKNLRTLFTAFALCGILLTACDDDNGVELPPPYENEADASVWFYQGSITVGGQSDGSAYSEEDLVVKLVFNDERTRCNIVMYNARFAGNMPVRLDIVINGADVTVTDSGYRITGDGIVPRYELGGQWPEMPEYTLTGLTVTAEAGSVKLSSMFGSYPVEYTADAFDPASGTYGDEGEEFTEPAPEPITPPSDAVYEGVFTVEGSRGIIDDPIMVGLTFDDYGIGKMVLYNATFTPGLPAGGMPRMDIEIGGIACAINDEGTYILTGDGIIPVARDEEVEDKYIVSDLEGIIEGEHLRFSMICGTTPAAYDGLVSDQE